MFLCLLRTLDSFSVSCVDRDERRSSGTSPTCLATRRAADPISHLGQEDDVRKSSWGQACAENNDVLI